jgi:hypothetical protein
MFLACIDRRRSVFKKLNKLNYTQWVILRIGVNLCNLWFAFFLKRIALFTAKF